MSYPNDIYSPNDDSDGKSFSEELSPTDGYFNRSGMPGNIMVPDPSIDCMPVEAKTLIPPSGSQATDSNSGIPHHPRQAHNSTSLSYVSPSSSPNHDAPTSPNLHTPVSTVSPRRREPSFSGYHSLMNNPPPAYSPSPLPALPSSVGSRSQVFTPLESNRLSYSTFPEQHLERGFLSVRQPESMGGPVDDPNERTPLVNDSIRYSPRRRWVRKVLFVALVFAVIGTITSIVLGCKASSPKQTTPSNDSPFESEIPESCVSGKYQTSDTIYEFLPGQDLTVIQETHGPDQPTGSLHVNTSGKIHLRRIPADSKHGNRPYITLKISTSEWGASVPYTWSQDEQKLLVSTPRYAAKNASANECVLIEITAWFPEDVEFANIIFKSVSLSMTVFDNLKIKVTGTSKFHTISGPVWFPSMPQQPYTETKAGQPTILSATVKSEQAETSSLWSSDTKSNISFSSRRIVVETISGSIKGTYPLLDELLISSESGSVKVMVEPQPASKSKPAPADLEVQTASGSIEVNLPIPAVREYKDYMPIARDYITRVHSTAGSIHGNYYLGSESSFKTTSGSINLYTLPILKEDNSDKAVTVPPNVFETHTVSGSTSVFMLQPIFFLEPNEDALKYAFTIRNDTTLHSIIPLASKINERKNYLRTLRSHHSSNTGSVKTQYPPAWQGSVHAKTVSGSIKVEGDGFRTIKERKGWAFNEVLKRRGVEGKGDGSFVEMGNISGSLALSIWDS